MTEMSLLFLLKINYTAISDLSEQSERGFKEFVHIMLHFNLLGSQGEVKFSKIK